MTAEAYPFTPIEKLELHPRYAELRAECPVARVSMPYGGEAWLLTRYADIRQALADPRFSRAATVDREDIPRTSPLTQPGGGLLAMDPPEHSRVRRLAAKAFTMRNVELLRPRAQQIVDELLDAMLAAGSPGDLAEAVSWPLPITIICEMLGVPYADRDSFRTWTDTSLALRGTETAVIQDARDQLWNYLAELVNARRAEPADDLLSELIRARDEDDKLSERELVSLAVTLLVAGHETTANQLGNSAFTLLSQHGLWAQLVADPALVPNAVEELLRVTPLGVGPAFPRVATEDLEIDGQTIRAGDTVAAYLAAGNRDAAIYDRPDEIDFTRAEIPHVTFGHGAHHCLGAPLARLELNVTLDTLVRRVPTLRLAVPADAVKWREDRLIRGVRALPVAW